MNGSLTIDQEDRTWAVIAHLSGFTGYLIPFGGVIAPIVIIFAKSDSPVISTIAKQALVLNIVAFLSIIPIFILAITIILISVAWLLGALVTVAAIALPIIGAVKAWDGHYFRYPVVGRYP